jgi:hypothetical protein
MTTELKLVGDIPLEVPADYSSYQYRLCYINSNGQAELGNAGTPNCMILQDKPNAAGRAGAFRVLGISKVQLGGTVAKGDQLIAGTDGKAENRGATTGVWVIGYATDEGADGEVGSVLIQPFHI